MKRHNRYFPKVLSSLVLSGSLLWLGAWPGRASGSSIQDLIDAAAPGSTLTLPPGTNYGPVEIKKDLTLQGAGAEQTALHGSNTTRVLIIGPNVTVTVNDLKITGGYVDHHDTEGGVGVFNAGDLAMNRCSIEQNTTPEPRRGGGLLNQAEASLTMTDCLVKANWAGGPGGGILNSGTLTMDRCRIEGNGSGIWGSGGGIASTGPLTLKDCAIRNNWVDDGSGGGICAGASATILNNCTVSGNKSAFSHLSGGGIYGGHPLILNNCTISGNRTGDGVGGGIAGEAIHLNHCTITRNIGSAGIDESGGGGIYGTVLECQNTIIAGNSTSAGGSGAPDCKGTIHSLGYNLIGNGSGCIITPAAGDQIGTALAPIDPRLGPLQDNGGPTQTHLLLAGSPALDQGSSGGLSLDQRGLTRPHDFAALPNAQDGSDIGAVEMQAAELPVNLPPSISSIQDQVLLANHTSEPIAFTVGDKETPAGQLTVSAQTRAIYALKNSSVEVRLGGSGTDRTVTLAAQEGIGFFVVTLTVTDGQGASAASSFFVTVRSPGQAVFSSASPVSIPDHGSASPYPSTLTVQNMDGVVDKVTVILHELRHTYPRDLGFLLVSPAGKAVLLMAAAGGGYDLNNVTLEFDEAAAGLLPQNAQIVSGTYQPSGHNRYFPFTAPAPSARPYSTALSGLRGSEPNGTWSLYVLDSAAYDQGALRKGWTLHLKTQTGAPPSISPIADQVTAVNTSLPLLLFTVSDPDTPLAELTVSAVSEDQALVPDHSLLVGGRGAQRTLLLLTAANKTGSVRLRLQASDGAHTVSQSFQLTISGSPGSSLSGWNTAPISIPDHGPAAPYPSTLSMVNLEGVIHKAVVTLHGLSHTWPADVRALLVGPFGQKVLLMANAGYRHPLDQVTLQLEDSAGQSLPASAQITSGIYQPTSLSASGSLPPPAPAGPYATTLSALNRTLPNGIWSLYVWDDSAYDQGSLIQGWGLTLFTRQEGAPLISAIPDQTTVRNTATAPLLFTVSDAEVSPDQLTVTAQSGNQDLVPNANLILGGRGANRTLVIIPAPNRTGLGAITLYASNGKTTGARSFTLHINPASPDSRSYLNAGAIAIRDHTTASPYPSTIEVSGLAGAVGRVTVTLLGLSHTWPEDISLILAGPAGQKCWLMGHAGRNQRLDHIALQFSDAAASGLPKMGPIVSGIFKPTSFTTRTLPAPAPAGPYAASLAVFQGQAPNGTWSLYLTDDQALDQGQIAQGWILTLVSAPAGAPQAVATAAPLRSGGAAPFWLEVVGRWPDGTVQLRLHGRAGERYLIQASSDQAHWHDLPGEVMTGDILDLKVGLSATHRFYRAKLESKSKPK